MSAETHQLKEKTVSGAKWNLLNQLSKTALNFVYGIVMARLLAPSDFGLLGMIIVFSNFALILTESGFGRSLVQYKWKNRVLFSSVFWINLAIGGALALLFAAGAGVIASFYSEPRLEPLVYVFSFHLLFVSLNVVQKNLLEKDLQFKGIFIGEVGAFSASIVIAIAMAAAGAGYWAIISQVAINSLVNLIFFWVISDWKPTFHFSRRRLSLLTRFSVNLLATKSLNYWMRNLDNLLVARFFGAGALGIYSMAYRILMFPLQNVSGVLGRVFFSAYSRIQNDPKRIKQIHIRVLQTVTLVSFPTMAILGGGIENFVYGLLGEKWAELIPLLFIFIPISLLQTINRMNGPIYLALGKTDLQFRVNLVLNISIVVAFVVGLRWGILGVATAYMVASVLNFYPAFHYASRLIGLSLWEVISRIKMTILGSALAAGISWFTGELLGQRVPHLPLFFLQSAAGGGVFLILTWLTQKKLLIELKQLIRQRASSEMKEPPPELIG